jgi:arylsulfatase A-like enzyme
VRVEAENGRPAQSVLQIALWLGLICGLAELALTLAQKPLTDPSPGFFRMNRHIVWTIPTVNLAVFGLSGVGMSLLLRSVLQLGVGRAIAPLVFLSIFALLLSCRWLHALGCLLIALACSLKLARRIDHDLPSFLRLVRGTLPAIGLVLAGWTVFWVGLPFLHPARRLAEVDAPTSGLRTTPDVLLVVLDTVRADHLSLYGYQRDTSPNLRRLAGRGVTFEQARSTAPWTLPSHTSMMTGRWPHELSAGINRPLDDTHRTLAEHLGARGYATAGFVANATYCGAETGLARGFSHFEDHVLTLADVLWTSALGQRVILQGILGPEPRAGGNPNEYHRKDGESVRRDFLAWLMRQGSRPFFAFLNLYDAHDPYMAPEPFGTRFRGETATAASPQLLQRWFIQEKTKLSPAQIQSVIDAYDDGIAYLDDQVGRLFGDLERIGRLANTVVIVTADHGEHLGEHGLYGHASSLYDAEIRVPLLIFLPGGDHGGQRIGAQASLRDLAATVADLTNAGGSPFPGRPLSRYWTGAGPPLEEFALCEVDAPVKCAPNQGRSPVFRGPMKAVVSNNHIYISGGDGKAELFDVAADPEQLHNLSGLPESRANLDRFHSALNELLHQGNPARLTSARSPRGSR